MQLEVSATDTTPAWELRRRVTLELAKAGQLTVEIASRNGWYFVVNGVGGACHGVAFRSAHDAIRAYGKALKEMA